MVSNNAIEAYHRAIVAKHKIHTLSKGDILGGVSGIQWPSEVEHSEPINT